jgi:L-asparaginase
MDIWLKPPSALISFCKRCYGVITVMALTPRRDRYFLNLVVKSKKPVVVVGSMRPGTAMSADGPLNMYRSVILAGSKAAIGKGVMVMLNDTIHSGRDVTKTITDRVDTFKAAEIGPLGFFTGDQPVFYRQTLRKHTADSEFDVSDLSSLPRVDIVYHMPEMAEHDRGSDCCRVKGLVHAGTGNGSIGKAEYPAVTALKKGVIVVRSARVGNGIIARNGEADDDKYGFIASDNLNPQKARILLMLSLTKTNDVKKIQEIFWQY